jgi:hypothetical protein
MLPHVYTAEGTESWMKQISQLFYLVICLFEKFGLFKLNCETFAISVAASA